MTLRVNSLSAGYGKTLVLKDLSARFNAATFHALLGPNGSGKSTLLKVLAGILKPRSGEIEGLSLNKPRTQQVAYLSQTRLAHPQMLVRDVIALGRMPYQKPFGALSEQDHAIIEEVMEHTQCVDLATKPFGTLSGGQQARILLARALAVKADILLVDEPIAGLDPYFQITILETLKREAQKGCTVIAAIHDLSRAKQIADEVCILNSGQVFAKGSAEDTLTSDVVQKIFGVIERDGKWLVSQNAI